MRTPPATFFIKKAAGLKTTGKPGAGSKLPGATVVGSITMEKVREIAKMKMERSQHGRSRVRSQDDRRLGPLDGHSGGGVIEHGNRT